MAAGAVKGWQNDVCMGVKNDVFQYFSAKLDTSVDGHEKILT
jgi:hypothetical protein